MTPPAAFVAIRCVDPDVSAGIDVTRSHPDDFTRSHAGQKLQPDHGGNLRSDIRQCQLDRVSIDWLDWFRLSCLGAAKLQAGDGAEGLVDTGRG